MLEPVETDAVIVGAGPVGLFGIFQLGLIGLKVCVVDAFSIPGGQCAALYPEKPIFDIPALPIVTGKDLVEKLLEQSQPFGATFYMGETVKCLECQPEGDFITRTDRGTQIRSKVVVVAAGGGAVQPKRPPIPGISQLEGRFVFYSVQQIEKFREQDILIVGGGDSAIDWALRLHSVARSVTLLHRRPQFRAIPENVRKVHDLVLKQKVSMCIGQIVRVSEQEGKVRADVQLQDGQKTTLYCSRMLPFFGLTGDVGFVAEWGLQMDAGRILVETKGFQSSTPGIYAIGDIAQYPGKRKLILSGFHESALMAQAVYEQIHSGATFFQKHTTSSEYLRTQYAVK